MQELVKDLTSAIHRTQGFDMAQVIEPPEAGTMHPYRDRNGIVHVPVTDISNEWKLQDKVWIQLPPF